MILKNLFLFISITNIIQMKEKEKDVVWPIRMKQSLKDRFKDYCDKNGFSMNKRIKVLIEQDIKDEKTNN